MGWHDRGQESMQLGFSCMRNTAARRFIPEKVLHASRHEILRSRNHFSYGKNCATCSRLGGFVKALTTTRQSSEITNAGKIASLSAKIAGKWLWTKGKSQQTVTTVPAAIAETAPCPFTRRE